ncbi:hypothetical protein AB0K52_23600 [Glycomyces sp. NPDC049804]|uniref:hypothetical protein n=1 Tax=Glycomyces sp. NPDC049804 TaxID=3154363 RepID=UPI00343C2D0A
MQLREKLCQPELTCESHVEEPIEYGRWAAPCPQKHPAAHLSSKEGEPPMAESTLRQNRHGATHQLTTTVNQARMRVLLQQAFYRHDHLGPGAPLREITGQGEGDGYYDWAGRRLFLADGEPDPMCPGAYRYQHNPACCDLEAPDSDPRSPRYEPMHLRHKPGDTWIIDTNRPYDPFDPGPYGSPGWYKDERTGRHRRDETPDPLPAEDWIPPANAWFPGTADWPEPEPEPIPAPTRAHRRGGHDHDHDRRDESQGRGGSGHRDEPQGRRGGADRPPPWGLRGRPVPSEPDEPEAREEEPRRPRFWPDREHPRWGSSRATGDWGWISGACDIPTNDNTEPEDPPAHRFSKLREDAFDRFIANSAQLRAAHFAPQKPYLRERAAWMLRWLVWVFAIGLVPMPAPLKQQQHPHGSAATHPIPMQHVPDAREKEAERAEKAWPADEIHTPASPAARPQPVEADASRRPGVAMAAAIGGARAARKTIADRTTRTNHDLAAAVRNSANRTSPSTPGTVHWRTQPCQNRPRPSPRPQPSTYMTAWEHAFDTSTTLIFGGAA